jgi:glycosyltransferase involved in cell wall biosynthesis
VKICFIANPNSTHTQRWVTWMAHRGHSVQLIADAPLSEPWPEIPVYDLPARLNVSVVRYFFWEFWLRKILHDWEPDILHAHRVSSAGWLGAFSRFHPFVVTPWGSDLYLHPQRSVIARWLAKTVLARADLVTADSADLCRKAISFGAQERTTHLIQWGVDLATFKSSSDAAQTRQLLGIGEGPVILSPRGLHPVYNIDTIIRSIPPVKQEFPGVVYLLRKYNSDSVYQAQVVNLIRELRLEQNIRWIGRVEPWERLADYYSVADIVLSVPSSDSTSVSLLEAFACGASVIASDLPSVREWIVPGNNGDLVPVKDHAGLALATLRLLRDPQRRLAYAEKNKIIVREKADHQKEMQKMESLYLGLLSSAPPQQ